MIAVGQAAASALAYNPCGWPNPSTDSGGSTPFSSVSQPDSAALPAGQFLNAATAASAQLPARAAALAYYAAHATLPAGVTARTLPAAASTESACLGSPA